MARDARERFATAGELRDALLELERRQDTAPPPAPSAADEWSTPSEHEAVTPCEIHVSWLSAPTPISEEDSLTMVSPYRLEEVAAMVLDPASRREGTPFHA